MVLQRSLLERGDPGEEVSRPLTVALGDAAEAILAAVAQAVDTRRSEGAEPPSAQIVQIRISRTDEIENARLDFTYRQSDGSLDLR